MTSFKAVNITDNVFWVGAIDWAIRNFHGYSTNRGTSYNAFLVLDQSVTLIDTVKRPFMNEMISRIASVVDPREIQYIVSNHAEMDHSGSLPDTIKEVKPDKIISSNPEPDLPSGNRPVEGHFHGRAKPSHYV